MGKRLNGSGGFGEEDWIIAGNKSDLKYLSWGIKGNPENVCLCLKSKKGIEEIKAKIAGVLYNGAKLKPKRKK